MNYREKVRLAFEPVIQKHNRGERGLVALSASEFVAVHVPRPAHGDAWGRWTLDPENLILRFWNAEKHWDYEIDLERIGSMCALWLTVKNFVEKGDWLRSSTDVGDLTEALHDLLGNWLTAESVPSEMILRTLSGN